jgi:glycosyltransferase involved in cell wall biosynthesis
VTQVLGDQSVTSAHLNHRRPRVAFIAWAPGAGRAGSISRELGGESRTFYDLGIRRKTLVPFRYLISAIRTIAYLIRRRPRAVIVQSPPVPAAVLVMAWAKLARAPVVLDTHPASFALDGNALDRTMLPLLASLASRADGCIVTTPELGDQITRWKGRPLVVHEAPMEWAGRIAPRDGSTQRSVLFVCTFAPDEPLMEVLDAARQLPSTTFRITGDHRRLPARARRAAPANVDWVGYLTGEDYVSALADADVVIALTQRRESVQRSAHEAVDADRPLVLSDWPHMKALFPYAIRVDNSADGIRDGIEEAFRRRRELRSVARRARELQHGRWREQLGELQAALGVD